MPLPHRSGYYWAKWQAAAPDTREAQHLTPSRDWEVVWVFENGSEAADSEYLRVLVVGVEQSQKLDDFQWGPGPITAPAS